VRYLHIVPSIFKRLRRQRVNLEASESYGHLFISSQEKNNLRIARVETSAQPPGAPSVKWAPLNSDKFLRYERGRREDIE